MAIRKIKCDSGLTGWMDKLQNVYKSYAEFQMYCDNYNIHGRLGFDCAGDAWLSNPWIQGSVNPSDLRICKPSEVRRKTRPKTKWWIVTGRTCGMDEDVLAVVRVRDEEAATEKFAKMLTGANYHKDWRDWGSMKEPPHPPIYINSTVECGKTKPKIWS
jgi:hypothetical protein